MFKRFIFKIYKINATSQKERRIFAKKLNELHFSFAGKIEPTVKSICGHYHSDIFNTESPDSVERIKKLLAFLKSPPNGFEVKGFIVKECDFAKWEINKGCPFEQAKKYAIENF